MQIAYFDCPFGAAGDMLLGSLIGAGLPEDRWKIELLKIALPEDSYRVRIEETVRCTIKSKLVTVEEKNIAIQGHCERALAEILVIIDRSAIARSAKDLAKKIFVRLGEAEAKVHGVPVEQIHFHELGAFDTIIDIVGFAIGYHMLGIDKSFCSPLPLGNGIVETQHGFFPVPGPAVALLLSDSKAPARQSDIAFECLTPTAAAILTTIAASWGNPPPMIINSIGYGAGQRDPETFPNVARLFLGEPQEMPGTAPSGTAQTGRQFVAVLEANLDDCSPQVLSYTVDRLFEAGALDVAVVPMVMKKGRSGHLLSVISLPDQQVALEDLIVRETSTIGVRSHLCERVVLERRFQEVALSNGTKVRVKLAFNQSGTITNVQPEYDDCASYAIKYGVPLKDVMAEVLRSFSFDNGL